MKAILDRLHRARSWLVTRSRGLPAGVFVLVALVTVLGTVAVEQQQAERDRAELGGRADLIATVIERRANVASAYLRAGAATLGMMQTVEGEDFRRFVSELRLDNEYLGSDGIGWVTVVRPGEEAAFAAKMARSYEDPPLLHPRSSGAAPYALPVTFFFPDNARNRAALGFDMASEETRRLALAEAAETGQPVASNRVVLRQERDGADPGFLIFMPVFEQQAAGRRLMGYIYSPFNAREFLEAALGPDELGEYRVRLYDGTLGEPGSLLHTMLPQTADDWEHVRRVVYVASNPFLVEVHQPPGPRLSGLGTTVLVFGLLLAGLLMILVRMLTRRADADRQALAWFEEQASIRDSLTRELNHRVKNTLASVLSIIALTRRRASSVEEFAEGLDGRVRALSATHDLLTQSDWGATPLRAIVETELRPYAQDEVQQVVITGPPVELAPNDALSIGLALHELATNAAKYGALSQPGGRVEVTWQFVSDAMLNLEWRERGGPPLPARRGRGFGTDLIERIVARELRQPVKIEFEAEGVRCVLPLPVRRPSAFVLRSQGAGQASERGRGRQRQDAPELSES